MSLQHGQLVLRAVPLASSAYDASDDADLFVEALRHQLKNRTVTGSEARHRYEQQRQCRRKAGWGGHCEKQ
jgi:hypothetical protein